MTVSTPTAIENTVFNIGMTIFWSKAPVAIINIILVVRAYLDEPELLV
jgi:hypothetical protein